MTQKEMVGRSQAESRRDRPEIKAKDRMEMKK